ncbi:MAG: hypothetical protein CBC16_02965, partial [Verrucomicrobia bacterium TMED56]
TEREALIGVSMTGIASGKVLGLDTTEAAQVVKMESGSSTFETLGWLLLRHLESNTEVKKVFQKGNQ